MIDEPIQKETYEGDLDSTTSISEEARKYQIRGEFEKAVLWDIRKELGLEIEDVKPVIQAVLYCIYNNPHENITTISDNKFKFGEEKNIFWATLFKNFTEVQKHNPESTRGILNTPKKRELLRHIRL